MGLSVREVEVVLDWLGVDRCYQAVWNWKEKLAETQRDPPTAAPSRVAVDETQIKVDGNKKWLYAAIDTESKLLLEVDVFSRRGTDPAAAFLHRLTEKHDVADVTRNRRFLVGERDASRLVNAEFLVDAGGYLTGLSQRELSGQLDYSERNHIEKWFQTVAIRIDRFHSF